MRYDSLVSLTVALVAAACSPADTRRMGAPGADGGAASGGAGGGSGAGGAAVGGRGGGAPDASGGRDAGDPADSAPGVDGAQVDLGGADRRPFDGGGSDRPVDGGGPTDGAPGGRWVAPAMVVGVGNDGRRMQSLDGVAWTGDVRDTNGNRDGPKVFRDVTYANGVLVAVGGGCTPDCVGRVMTFDGRSWTEVMVPDLGRLNGVAFGNGVWVAVGGLGAVLRSTDNARTWTPTGRARMPSGLRAVAFGRVGAAEMFVAVGDGYARLRSLDGLNWTDLHPSNGSTDELRAVAIGNGVAVAVGGKTDLGRRWRTTDGVTWTDDLLGGPDLLSLLFIEGRFMAFSGTGDDTVHTSSDGKTWLTLNTSGAGSNVAAGYLNGGLLFVSRVSPSTVKISGDGITWRAATASMPGDATINAFAFAGE